MRELKFRAWNKRKNEMLFFNLFDYNACGWWDYIKETAMQYTGLKDKTRTKQFPEGKEIYEGDIVEIEDTVNEEMFGGKIEIIRETVIFEGGSFSPVGFIPSDEFEIIGNIHENPELL